MEFFYGITSNVDKSYISLDSEPYVPPSKKKKEEKKEERNAKMQLWKSLTKSLKSKTLEECQKANFFGKIVTDTLLQYESKE